MSEEVRSFVNQAFDANTRLEITAAFVLKLKAQADEYEAAGLHEQAAALRKQLSALNAEPTSPLALPGSTNGQQENPTLPAPRRRGRPPKNALPASSAGKQTESETS